MINNSKLPLARDKLHISITFDSVIAFCEHSERHRTLCVHTTESLESRPVLDLLSSIVIKCQLSKP